MTIRNCRGNLGFEFDQATRDFIKKIRAKKISEPEKLHLNLAQNFVVPTRSNYSFVNAVEMEKCGWIRK